jgi:predicted N-acetyltransferase YhbS
MTTELRPAETRTSLELVPTLAEHVDELGRICYEAFKDIHDRHHFPLDFPSVAFARQMMRMLVQGESHYGVAALRDRQLAGSNFLWLSDEVAGVGPISTEVPLQGCGIGRALMQDVVDRAKRSGFERIRLVQDAFNMASLSLYASVGFDVKEALVLMQPGPAPYPDKTVRSATAGDLDSIDGLSRAIYKVSRRNEVAEALTFGFPVLVREHGSRVVGYLTPILIGHGVAETPDDALALVGQAGRMLPPEDVRIFCPLSEGELYRQFLKAGCRAIKVMNLMTIGPYERPDGVWMPSVLY